MLTKIILKLLSFLNKKYVCYYVVDPVKYFNWSINKSYEQMENEFPVFYIRNKFYSIEECMVWYENRYKTLKNNNFKSFYKSHLYTFQETGLTWLDSVRPLYQKNDFFDYEGFAYNFPVFILKDNYIRKRVDKKFLVPFLKGIYK